MRNVPSRETERQNEIGKRSDYFNGGREVNGAKGQRAKTGPARDARDVAARQPPSTMGRRASRMKPRASLLLVLLLIVPVALWLGPRPVVELWIAEVLTPERAAALKIADIPELRDRAPAPDALRSILAQSGVSAEDMPAFEAPACLLDVDGDEDLDVISAGAQPAGPGANEGTKQSGEPQPSRVYLYLNGGRGGFRELGEHVGPAFTTPRAARACAAKDLDADGKMDVVLQLHGGTTLVLWNRMAEKRG